MYQFTFWFVYVVYVFGSVGFFGEEIARILTVWGFRLEGSNSVFSFGVAILQRFGGRGEEISSEVFQLSHCFCWIFLDGNKVRVRPACSPFTFFSPSTPVSVSPSYASYTIIIPPRATFVNPFFIVILELFWLTFWKNGVTMYITIKQ